MPVHVKDPSPASSLRALARDLRRAGRSIGLMPFLACTARKRTRICARTRTRMRTRKRTYNQYT